jgi:hypothetical protein
MPAAACTCPAHTRGVNNAAAMLAATGTAPVILRDRFDGAEEVACYHDLGQYLARSYTGEDCRITRDWCEQWLMAIEGMINPLSDGQWALLADAIEAELAKMVAQEKRDAIETNTEEREIASVVRGGWADAAVAAE